MEEIKNASETENAEIKEAQIEEINLEKEIREEMTEKKKSKKRKWDLYFELVLFLVLGILIGIAIKTEAAKKITIGFDDYRMKIVREDYNFSDLQASLVKKQQAAQAAAAQNQPNNSATPDNSANSGDNTPSNNQ